MPNVVVSQLLFVAIAVQSDKGMTIQCSEGWKCAKDSTVANLPSGTGGGFRTCHKKLPTRLGSPGEGILIIEWSYSRLF